MNIDLRGPRRRLDIAGSPLSFLDVGSGDAVVLAHSYLWGAEMWRPQIDALSGRYRVIVPELWGHALQEPFRRGREILPRSHVIILLAG